MQDIDRAESFEGALHHLAPRLFQSVRSPAVISAEAPPARASPSSERAVSDSRAPARGEFRRAGRADALRGAGNQDDFAVKTH